MSFPVYQEYRSAGLEWLNEVPAHWEQVPLWTLFNRLKRTGFADEQLLSVYRDFGVIPKASRDDNYNKSSDDLSAYQLVEPGDLAINKMKAWQGSVAISEYRGIVSPAYHIYKARHSESPRYLHHLFRCKEYISGYLANSKGIRVNQWDLEPQQHSRMPVLLPPFEEQNQIARFLDHETAKIDALIREQERLIKLLQEKRQAVISHAVTMGLDSDVPVKDSEVEWLGEVPAHWSVTRLKFGSSLIVDCPHETPSYDPDGDFLVIRTADINEGVLDSSSMFRLKKEEYLRRTRRASLKKLDIIYGREGERWGHAAIVPESGRFCLGQRMMQFRPSDEFDPEFLMYQLNSLSVYRQGAVDTVGATSPHVNVSTIQNFVLTRPPIDEQVAIGTYLKTVLTQYDGLIFESKRSSETLRERRSALISAAVTGKIDVRNWRPPADESAFDEDIRRVGMAATA